MAEIIHSIKYPFAIDRGLGKLYEENRYDDHVVQMMKQVLFTNPGDRINQPDFGCGLQRMVFEPNSDLTAGLLKVTVIQSLERWMSTVINVIDVITQASDAKLEIKIIYFIKARQERRFLNIELTL
ncbi:MAG: GPW/gp25 family protein [Chitinophagaceae bacterium]|nr:GPW/gp25 family protein [Chitinophagaceae bacterium]